MERVSDVVLDVVQSHVVLPKELDLGLKRVLELAQRLHVLLADVVDVTHRRDNIGDVEVGLVRRNLRLEDVERLLVQLVCLFGEAVELRTPLLLRAVLGEVLGLELVRLAGMHDDERPVGVGADAMDVLLDVDRLLEGLERLLDSAQLQQRDAHLVDRARDHGVQVAEMVELDREAFVVDCERVQVVAVAHHQRPPLRQHACVVEGG
mmetsp:Transcript_16255/g.38978  ORF Transcript_16255/g.38978 Transcript_16255/m.38978 type:complete len:207 (-) Transcript_16255:380-1000(-)